MNIQEMTDQQLLDYMGQYGIGHLAYNQAQAEAARRDLARCDNHPDSFAESNQIMDGRFGRVAYCHACINTEAQWIQ